MTKFAGETDATQIDFSQRYRWVAWLVAGTYFMELLDGTVIATALPQIAQSFHVSAVALNIGMTAYLLTLGVFIPISGWVAERFGIRSVFGSAIALFTLASVLCGFTHGLWTFTAARVLQGIGGAMMVPVGRLAVLRTTDKKDLMRVMALIVWPGLVAPVLGPAVGGFLTTYLSWPWIFFLNAPLGVVALALNFALVPNLTSGLKRRLDVAGFFLTGLAVVLLVYGLDRLGQGAATPGAPAWATLAPGAAFGALAAWHLRRDPEPLLDFQALRTRTFSVVIYGGSIFRIAISTAPFLLPLMFQLSFGADAFTSGLLVMAVFMGNLMIKPATKVILRAFGFRNVLLVNGVLTSVTLAACGFLWPSTPLPVLLAILFSLGGVCRSLHFTALSTLQFADVPQAQMNGANTLSSVVTQLSMGAGVAIGALAVNFCTWLRGARVGAPTIDDFHHAFFLIGALSLFAIVDCFPLAKNAGRLVSGHRPSHPD